MVSNILRGSGGAYLCGSIKGVEHVLHAEGEDLAADAEHGVSGLDGDEVVGLLDGLDDGLDVEGLDGAEIDDLALDAVLLLEVLGRDQGLADAARERDDGDVLSNTLNLGLSNGDHKVVALGLLRHGEDLAIEQLVLEHTDGVGVADGSLQEPLGVLCTPGSDDLEPGDAAVPRGVILRVLGSDTGCKSVGATESDVAGLLSAGHVVGLCAGIDDLVNGLHLFQTTLVIELKPHLREGVGERIRQSSRS